MAGLGWRIGVELEWMAPEGRTRRDLAEIYAGPGGTVVPFFQHQSEPSLVPDMATFESLTLGFRAVDASGAEVARCVDDVTLVHGLDPRRPPRPGWYRIVSDDQRLLQLLRRVSPADGGIEAAVAPVAALFGTEVEHGPMGMRKVVDAIGSPICIAAPVPGERERPCEVITPPIDGDTDLGEALERLMAPARRLGFTIPRESATHLHFEAKPLEEARVFAALVERLHADGDALRAELGTNPHCTRLGRWPAALLDAVRAPDFRTLSWPAARERLSRLKLSKYVDFNVKNLAHPRPDKPTFEVRVLPGAMHPEQVVAAARRFVGLLREVVADAGS